MTARGRAPNLNRLLRPAAEIVDQANIAARFSRQTNIAAVQDQPVMGVPNHRLQTPNGAGVNGPGGALVIRAATARPAIASQNVSQKPSI